MKTVNDLAMNSSSINVISLIVSVVFLILAGPAGAQDEPYTPAFFKEMMPDVAYSATRSMEIEAKGMQQTMEQELFYTPFKERAVTNMQGMEMTTLTLFDQGVMYTSTMGYVSKGDLPPLDSDSQSAGGEVQFDYLGDADLNGVAVKKYAFSYTQSQADKTYQVEGLLYRDSDDLPRGVDFTIVDDLGETMRMRQRLRNVDIGPQDPSLFEPPAVSSGGMFGALMPGASTRQPGSAGGQSPSAGAGQKQSITGRIQGWPGGSGTLVTDEGVNLGTVAADGAFTLTLAGSPAATLRPLENGFRCEGATLTNGEAGYHSIGRFLGVTDASGKRTGRIQAASSPAVASWVINPQSNSAVPGYGLQFTYVERQASSVGDCNTGSELQQRGLNWSAGWNVEQISITAVGKSPYFPTDAPTETAWITVDAPPTDVVWYFDGSGASSASNGRSPNSNAEDDVAGRVAAEAADATEEAVTEGVRGKLFKGIGRIFR